ncbi:MAG: RlpA-like double-psi beta-barrel domain-containing protein [Patescibacteria group bacterium]
MPKKINFTPIFLLLSIFISIFPTLPAFAEQSDGIWQESVVSPEPVNSGWQRMSPWTENSEVSATSIIIKINYFSPSDSIKQVFSFDPTTKKWQAWPSLDDRKNGAVSAKVDSSAKVALFNKTDSLAFGTASWYRYKNGLFAASPDFPKGTKLKITNLDNNKSVVVTVNDFGPERNKHPDRAVDLDLVAFEKIAKKSAGLIKVKVEQVSLVLESPLPVKAITPVTKKDVVVPAEIKKATSKPEVEATSAIAIWEKNGQVVYDKNMNEKLPLASLTKIVAVKVFLDTKISLNKVVTYKKADENFNYQYCSPWESAKLTVKEGDTMTVKDLLYASLVGSANNAVESLVRASGLKRDVFIAKMNSTVKKWGAKNTKFIEPTGLSPENVSSANDYAIITREALKDQTLQKIDTAKTYSFKTINTKITHNLKNTSKLLVDVAHEVTASKTGYLEEAGHCLMSRVKVNNENLIVVVFGAKSSSSSVEATKKIIDYSVAK